MYRLMSVISKHIKFHDKTTNNPQNRLDLLP